MNLKLFSLFLFLFFSALGYGQSKSKKVLTDSVIRLLERSKSENYSEQDKFALLKQAKDLAESIKNDSLHLLAIRDIRNIYFYQQDFPKYIKANHNLKRLALKLSDSLSIALAYDALGYAYTVTEVNDSAYFYYFKAINAYDNIGYKESMSFCLGNLATIQTDSKDYFSAEENAVKALILIDNVKETNDILDQKWILNNKLANIADALGNLEKALEYNNEALKVAQRMKDDFNNGLYSLNNIAFVKRKQGQYQESKEIFETILNEKNLFEYDPSFYALVLENTAYTNFLTGSYKKENVEHLFNRSYKIADSINDKVTKAGTVISMAKFYKAINEQDKALRYGNEAYDLAQYTNKNDILLESMLLLSELTEDGQSKQYLNEYIKLSDSLLHVERSVRNKYARIELETDQLAAKNKQISKENLYLIILSIGLLLTAILIYVIISQRAKNKELKLMQVQQQANEDIYNLLLGQQDKVDEARAKEKVRVSKELHDGVLGRLFGVRLSLDSINLKDGKEAMTNRANYIGQLKTIEEDIRKISHELNTDFVSGSGFMDIVSELIEDQTKAYGLNYDFNYSDDISWELVSNKTKINIYRIIQESMQNIYKHANAKTLKISIFLKNDVICLEIIDDGEGFDTSKGKKGIGLKNMSSRVAEIDGTISFTSQPGQGTTVNVNVPYINQS